MSFEACANLVFKGDPDRFACTMTAPPVARDALFALYAFNLEVSRAPWVTQEPMIAEMRLQWWLDTIDEIYQGGRVRSHEVVTPLAQIIADHELPREVFDALINARQWDIYKDAHNNAQALDEYISATYGGLMRLAVQCLGAVLDGLDDYSYGAGLAAYLCAIPALQNHNRIPLIDGTLTGVAELAQSGRKRYADGQKALSQSSKIVLPALRPGRQAGQILVKAVQNPSRVIEGRLAPTDFSRRVSLLKSVVLQRI